MLWVLWLGGGVAAAINAWLSLRRDHVSALWRISWGTAPAAVRAVAVAGFWMPYAFIASPFFIFHGWLLKMVACVGGVVVCGLISGFIISALRSRIDLPAKGPWIAATCHALGALLLLALLLRALSA